MSARFPTLAVLAAAGLVLAACGGKDEVDEAEAQRAVRVGRVELAPLNAGVAASGLLVPREEAAVTSELSGYRIQAVLVDQGAWVRAGQPLLRLDDALLRAEIEQQKAQLVQQELAAERAERESRRVEGLDDQGVLSQEDIDMRRFQARSARAAVDAAKARLRDLEIRLERTVVRAPVSGRVLSRAARPGDLSSGLGTEPLFRIARDGVIEVDAEASEDVLTRLRPGQAAAATLADGRSLQGRVRLVSAEIDPQTKLGRARVTLPVDANLRAGGFARVVFASGGEAVLSVPETSVRYDADGASVMALDASDRVGRVSVRPGRRGAGRVELLQGPAAGTRVLLAGAAFVLEGDRVTPVEGSAAPAGRGEAR